ncbi:alpha/beta-type small acid-soluble spore protein [Bacillus suaedaesalsae]|uniref:Alpha/beta-type small acid-soluble spore protein n=1 Tax=Bacillus suaedaesalsae TaxID=2810349 RepID=A0ABS2DGP7_9BACI|nr:alpha/beta-type small acid-soluble spore protein [Bacillus suaedaesalsae]MBM6617664.1 alpha/beta-type small acid-soluble spore protein [Bacillus suaedaesalsae]
MSKKRKPLVPEARAALNQLKVDVMKKEGYNVPTNDPDEVKAEVAGEVGVPLSNGYNGSLTSRDAGKVGGQIGGKMVSELIKMAKNKLNH